VLKLSDVHVAYGQIRATQGVSFTLEKGETLALIGSNGAGKSSTLKAIMGMASYKQGSINLDGHELKGKAPSEIVRLGVGYSPEGRRVFPMLSVQENLRVGGYTLSGRALRARMEQMYSYFPRLQERRNQMAGSLSGGEQQMLAIARALMSQPKVLLLDEPSLGLAPIIVQTIGQIVREIQERESLSVILAEQNANWAMRLAPNSVILALGRVVMAGPSVSLLNDAEVRRAYLGT